MVSEKQKIIQWIDSQQNNIIAFLQDLVSIPSDNPPGDCYPLAAFIEQRLLQLDFKNTALLEVSQEEVINKGMIRVANVIAPSSFGTGDGPDIALNAHGDVVAPGLGWMYDPYGGHIIHGKLYGRGSAVSKSDIAAYTYAVMALRQVMAQLSGKATLVFNFDEETGGEIGPKWLLANQLIKPDMAISAGFTHSIVNSHNGCLHLKITLKGKSAHAAAPSTGHDAIEAMSEVLTKLYEYRETLSRIQSNIPGIQSPTLVVGLISGGINTNVVPDECTIRLDRRLIPEEIGERVELEICQMISHVVEDMEGVSVQFERILLARSFEPTPVNHPLVSAIKCNWMQFFEGEPEIHGVPLYTDARHFAEAGIPVVIFGAGPRTLLEANGHRADEHIVIEDLMRATKIVALALYDLLKVNE